ncbi:hypothetical protein [Chitinophaga solisilvae]|uniref:hypothetical protein n=1 Tax=Chitinophaga solisilvae TaxID=1233460 RepID=UPI00136D9510|nr:hypothetical protein [Chitinophaga solisilvae]
MLTSANGEFQSNFILYIDLQLRYHFGLDPSQLDDDQWAQHWAILEDIRRNEAKQLGLSR